MPRPSLVSPFPLTEAEIAKTEAKILKQDNGCWIWQGHCRRDGYGVLDIRGQIYRAHRIVYELHNGPIPDGQILRHGCDNPSCVSPSCLSTGSYQDNTNDMVARGRHNPGRPMGEINGGAKLTNHQVQEIRCLVNKGAVPQRVAEKYGVSHGVVHRINKGMAWSHLPVEVVEVELTAELTSTKYGRPGTWDRTVKMDPDKVRRIRDMGYSGWSQAAIAREYGTIPKTIKNIIDRVTWRNVPEYKPTYIPPPLQRPGSKLSVDKVKEIKQLISDNVPLYQIARKYDVNKTTVSHIKCGRIWADV